MFESMGFQYAPLSEINCCWLPIEVALLCVAPVRLRRVLPTRPRPERPAMDACL
jgi:hypothetical protein